MTNNIKIGWILLKILAVSILLFHLYLEITFVYEWVNFPAKDKSPNLKYREAYGLFAPGFFIFESIGKAFSWFAPFIKFIIIILTIINTVLLLVMIPITKAAFKHKQWAAIALIIQTLVYTNLYIFK